MMKYLIWLDDIRNPFTGVWWSLVQKLKEQYGFSSIIWARTYEEFVYIIQHNGLPVFICFDNDLGEEKEGYDCAKWLIEYCLDHNCDAPDFYIQSDNGPAQDNIRMLINNYKKVYNQVTMEKQVTMKKQPRITLKNFCIWAWDQIKRKRFFYNMFISRNAWGAFSINSHMNQHTGEPKITYHTKKTACKCAEKMSVKRNAHFSYYKCLYCDGYHIGKNRDNKIKGYDK